MLEGNYPREVQVEFVKTANAMIEGQIMELNGITSKNYAEYIEKKTASVFSLIAKIPLIVYKIKNEKVLEFANVFGMIFQIHNDLKGSSKEHSILTFMKKDDAEKTLKEKLEHLNSFDIVDANKLFTYGQIF